MRRGVSAPVYFAGVALVSALLLGAAMVLRPSFAYAVRDSVGLEKPALAAPDSLYVQRVAPIFEKHCVGCHGTRRQKAELRLDSYAAALRGGKHGAVIRPGVAGDSELVARIMLPKTDARAMPPQGKEPLSADDTTVVRLWVAAGASPVQRAGDIQGVPPPVKQVTIPAIDEAAVESARAPLAASLAGLQARYPGAIAYASRGSADIEINASLLGSSFGDDDLAALAPLRERVVRLDLSGTAVTDVSAPGLAGMDRLQVLRALNTRITARSLAPLRDKGIKVHDGQF
jgi:mono/diheme cytochrome c family protein